IYVPYTGIIDYKTVASKYAEKILTYGGEIKYENEITSVKQKSSSVEVITKHSSFNTKIFINCCGLQSDEVAKQTGSPVSTRIIPFRGEYYKLKPEKQYLVKNLIYPVPDPAFPFLGVHFTRMLNGEVEAGPNAVLSFKKEGYNKTSFSLTDTFRTFSWSGFYKIAAKYYKTGLGEFYRSYNKKAFVKALQRLLPEIQEEDLVKGGSGVRAQAVDKSGKLIDDFLISSTGNIVNVINAPSPAATSSLAIGETICNLINKFFIS
ncbi:MAG: L-2-hydroxyglutarate oxidase, partial [Ignavibacteria bacterium]